MEFMKHFKTLVDSTPETNDYDHKLTPEIRKRIAEISEKVCFIQACILAPFFSSLKRSDILTATCLFFMTLYSLRSMNTSLLRRSPP